MERIKKRLLSSSFLYGRQWHDYAGLVFLLLHTMHFPTRLFSGWEIRHSCGRIFVQYELFYESLVPYEHRCQSIRNNLSFEIHNKNTRSDKNHHIDRLLFWIRLYQFTSSVDSVLLHAILSRLLQLELRYGAGWQYEIYLVRSNSQLTHVRLLGHLLQYDFS